MERKSIEKGDVTLVVFPFTDLSGEKRRPALVVGASEEHVVVAFITTRSTGPLQWHVSLSSSDESGLMPHSTVRCDKILSIDTKLISGAIGAASPATVKKVDAKLRRLLKL